MLKVLAPETRVLHKWYKIILLKQGVGKKERLWVSSHGGVERTIMSSKFTHNPCFVFVRDLPSHVWSHVENEGSK